MGINITEIGQKVLDLVQNGANVVKRLYDMHYNPTPMDVELPWIDENGQLNTYKIPNDAKKRQTYLDIIGAAIAKMNVTFYVDAQNGDDSNPGTADAPFASLKQAIRTAPASAYVVIYINGQYTHSDYVDLISRKVLIRGATTDSKITFTTTDTGGVSVLARKAQILLQIDADFKNTYDDTVRSIIYTGQNAGLILTNNYKKTIENGSTTNTAINIAANTRITSVTHGIFWTDFTDFTTEDSTSYICNIGYTASLALNTSVNTLNGNAITADDYKNLVTGILKDADSGNPINVISNINFSD